MRKAGMFFKIERCEMLAIGTLAAVSLAMRLPAMPNRYDVGRAMQTTKLWALRAQNAQKVSKISLGLPAQSAQEVSKRAKKAQKSVKKRLLQDFL